MYNDECSLKLQKPSSVLNVSYKRSNKMKWLKDYKITERTPHPVIKVLPMQFGNDEATRRIVIHHARRVILQHKEEIQKLAYK